MPPIGRQDFRGGAAKCTLDDAIDDSTTSLSLNGDTSGWPTGASGRTFTAVIDRGKTNQEKILCTSLTAGILTVDTRGYDGTDAQAHDANAVIEHGPPATVLDDYGGHTYDTTRDDHEQYVPVDGTRGFSALSDVADAPVAVGTANAEGTSVKLARADHVHDTAAGFIDNANKFGTGVVDSAALASNSVTNAKMADNAIDTAELVDLAVTSAKIAANAITNAKMADNSVDTLELVADSVTQAKIADDAVGTSQIQDDAVTFDKIANLHFGSAVDTPTGATGSMVVAHGAGFTPSKVIATARSPVGPGTFMVVMVDTIGATNFTAHIFNAASGAYYTAAPVTIMWAVID